MLLWRLSVARCIAVAALWFMNYIRHLKSPTPLLLFSDELICCCAGGVGGATHYHYYYMAPTNGSLTHRPKDDV